MRGLLALYIDAWPYRYLDILLEKLREVDPRVEYARLIPVFGYTDCFKVSLLTGRYPDEHGYWVSYTFSDSAEPKPLPRSLSALLDTGILPIRALRFILTRFTGVHMFHLRTWSNVRGVGIGPESPFSSIDAYLRAKGFETLFKLLELKGLKYVVLEDRFYGHKLNSFADIIARNMENNDVVLAYIDEPDFWGHRYGVDDPQYIGLLKQLSSLVRKLVKLAVDRGINYLIFSDHGMASVRKYIDIYRYILKDASYGRTYVVGIDATFFRIYYLKQRGDTPVLHNIKRMISENATKLDDTLEKYRLPRDRRYGDEIYALHEEVVLFPNFFSWLKPKGMHAYSPRYSNQHGVVLASEGLLKRAESVNAPDLYKLVGEGTS